MYGVFAETETAVNNQTEDLKKLAKDWAPRLAWHRSGLGTAGRRVLTG